MARKGLHIGCFGFLHFAGSFEGLTKCDPTDGCFGMIFDRRVSHGDGCPMLTARERDHAQAYERCRVAGIAAQDLLPGARGLDHRIFGGMILFGLHGGWVQSLWTLAGGH